MCKYFFSILLAAFLGLTTYAQDKVSKKIKVDTVKNKFLPTGLRVGLDVISLIRGQDQSFKGWEINLDTDFSRYYFTVDYGHWATNQIVANSDTLISRGNYQNDGSYLRVGADVNFLLKDPDKNMFFFGFRYGMSSFSEAVQYHNSNYYYPKFGQYKADLTNGSVNGHWFEITTGLRVKIYKAFWMGYTARLKFAPSVSGATNFASYDMPGYGIVPMTPYYGFNYQLFWRFGWKKPQRKAKN